MKFKDQFKPATEEEVRQAEERLQVKFPEDYRRFLMEVGGGGVDWDTAQEIVMEDMDGNVIKDTEIVDRLYGIHPGDYQGADLFFWMDEYGDEMWEVEEYRNNSFMIGDSPGNGSFFLVCEGEYRGVYYWDDVCEFETSTEECAVYWVKGTETFSDFLKLI